MVVTQAAAQRLQNMLARSGSEYRGYRVTGIVGTCRGSTPMIKPAVEPAPHELVIRAEGITFFARREWAQVLERATLDYDGRLLGKGLNLTWAHEDGKCPGCGQSG